MPDRKPTPDGLARQNTGPNDFLELEKTGGRVIRINWPGPGLVTVRHPDEREEVLSVEEFAAQERARQV